MKCRCEMGKLINRRAYVCKESGQAVVEFALIMPLLLLFILFIFDAGFFGFTYVSATNAVREGARCAAVGGNASAVASRVRTASGGLNSTTVTSISSAYVPLPAVIGGSVTVSADIKYDWITPVGMIPGFPDFVTYPKSSTMRMETSNTTTKTSC